MVETKMEGRFSMQVNILATPDDLGKSAAESAASILRERLSSILLRIQGSSGDALRVFILMNI